MVNFLAGATRAINLTSLGFETWSSPRRRFNVTVAMYPWSILLRSRPATSCG